MSWEGHAVGRKSRKVSVLATPSCCTELLATVRRAAHKLEESNRTVVVRGGVTKQSNEGEILITSVTQWHMSNIKV